MNIETIKTAIGVKLMSLGAKLCLNSPDAKEKFKQSINRNTTLGSIADSGDHLRGEINPMCDYDTQSVINVLKLELLNENQSGFNGVDTSAKETCYKEIWK